MELAIRAYEPVPPLCCDICLEPCAVGDVLIGEDGLIRGLIVCSLCVEENLAASIYTRSEVGMVGGGD